jgi:murein DD-endopeptidase MepM/ murein hydrolase activator NlpD
MANLKSLRAVAAALLMIAALGAGCAHVYTAHGAYYRVRKGDTLESVAKRYRTTVQDLAEVNNIENPEELKPGTSLYIPGVTPSRFAALLKKEGVAVRTRDRKERKARKGGEAGPETREAGEAGEEAPEEEKGSAIVTDRGRFRWPVEGEVSSLYGMRRRRKHDGIDIRAKTGTPVFAAAAGEVVYAKRMRGYGNLVLVKHEDDFFTVYAHNAVNLVKAGMKVKKGQMISRVGRTGRATGPHLHFEVREGPKARNPLFFLPKTMYAEKAKERKGDDYGGPEGEGDGEADGEIKVENP